MAELLKIEVTRKELDEGIIPTNMVLCEMYYSSIGAKTKSGIIYGVLTDITYADADNPDDASAHAADMAEVSMRVTKLPQKLYFNPEDKEKSMPWDTDMEICEEDVIFTNTIEALNAVTLVCEGKNYKLIPYQDAICAQRTHQTSHGYDGKTYTDNFGVNVVMLNGYVLCTLKNKESLSELDVTSQDKLDMTKGTIAFVGTAPLKYLVPEYSHIDDLRVGDEVLFSSKVPPFALERQKYSAKFSNTETYYVIHRRNINAVLNRK
jgi:hypothetical protein